MWYLATDFRTVCFTDEYNYYAKLGIGFILAYPVGVPLLLFGIVHAYRNELDDERTHMKLGLLYAGFRQPVYWFEMVKNGLFYFILKCS